MFSLLKKFFSNEWKDIKQTGVNAGTLLPKITLPEHLEKGYADKKVTKKIYPQASKIIKRISNESGVSHKGVFLTGNPWDTNAHALLSQKKITIERGNLENTGAFIASYAHELGHLKYSKLHACLRSEYLKPPVNLWLSATTNIYAIGLSAYAFVGDNTILDVANWLGSHSGKFLATAAVTNAVMIRTREHMADLFAYKHTGLLPSVMVENKRESYGIIDLASNTIKTVWDFIKSGYPTGVERDLVVKIFGTHPQTRSGVEDLNKPTTHSQKKSVDLVGEYVKNDILAKEFANKNSSNIQLKKNDEWLEGLLEKKHIRHSNTKSKKTSFENTKERRSNETSLGKGEFLNTLLEKGAKNLIKGNENTNQSNER